MSETNNSCGLIILAGGMSRRLGSAKQLLTFNNKYFIQNCIDLAVQTSCNPKVLVLGCKSEEILPKINAQNIEIEINTQWAEGIASSIRCGLEKCLSLDKKMGNVFFWVVDQPFLTLQIINTLIDSHKNNSEKITASYYKEQIGVPAIFNKKYFNEILQLSGDKGAKIIINNHLDEITKVNFEKGIIDIDTKEDYKKLNEMKN